MCNKILNQQRSVNRHCPNLNIVYSLFVYREELRKRKSSFLRLSRTKLLLTNGLISKTVKNINDCSADDLEALNREIIFKKQLMRQMHYRRMELQQQIRSARKMWWTFVSNKIKTQHVKWRTLCQLDKYKLIKLPTIAFNKRGTYTWFKNNW